MKNIHILPTDKLTKISISKKTNTIVYNKDKHDTLAMFVNQNIYITSDEEIKEGNIVKIPYGIGKVKELHWKYGNDNPSYIVEDLFTYKLRYGQKEGELQTNSFRYEDVKKIIITTDQDLIKDSVQAIPDEFLEWFVKNPSCEKVEVLPIGFEDRDDYLIIIPKEEPKTLPDVNWKSDIINKVWDEDKPKQREMFFMNATTVIDTRKPKQETIEEAVNREYPHALYENDWNALQNRKRQEFIKGAKWQQERSYSEEEVFIILVKLSDYIYGEKENTTLIKWFEQFKKK